MKIQLTGPGRMEIRNTGRPDAPPDGAVRMKVLCCAVCGTDARMWDHGHRDLILPRVPGHEMVVADGQGRRFVVWPGESCGQCRHCRAGRENLCDAMRITGFHRDGGFATEIVVPETSLIPLPDTMDTVTACFAEPVGCVLHALEKADLKDGHRVLIHGGGVMGLLTALGARHLGGEPLVIESNRLKIDAAGPFLNATDISCLAVAPEGLFDVAVNACADPDAFCRGMTKLDKGGRFVFFSGLTGNMTIDTDRINLMHYHEITLTGAYGLKLKNMGDALPFLAAHQPVMQHLIQAIVPPEQAPDIMPRVLSGTGFKYILDFTGDFI